jgi:2-dehydropantoate 2-reductase
MAMTLHAQKSPPPQPRITVAGAGSIGCYIGGCLALAHRDVTLLLRPGLAHAIAAKGLCLSDLDGNDRRVAPLELTLTSDPLAAFRCADIVLVTVKSGATEQMGSLIGQHAPAGAIVVSLQNGVGNVDILRVRLGPNHAIVAGMVPYNVVGPRGEEDTPRVHRASSGTTLIENAPLHWPHARSAGQWQGRTQKQFEGQSHGQSHGQFHGQLYGQSEDQPLSQFGGQPGDQPRGESWNLREILHVPGAPLDVHSDMTGILWGKLIVNLNNALNALCGLPLATQLADRHWRLVLAAQMQEALWVLNAARIRPAPIEGIPPQWIPMVLRLPDAVFRVVARRLLAIDPTARSSMWEDLQQRRATEIDYLQGVIVALARKAGMPAPISEAIMHRVRQAEAAGLGSPALQPDQCLNLTP